MRSLVNLIVFVVMTLLLIVAARYTMVLLHEWMHGTMAWILNIKSNPFDIYYGDWTLLHVDEDVNYLELYQAGKIWTVAIIAITPIIVNALMYLFSLWIISLPVIQMQKKIYAFIFWFALMNLGEIYSYIPIRTFGSHGDVGNFLRDLNISPWFIFIPGTLMVGIATWHFFVNVLSRSYRNLDIKSTWLRSFYLFLALIVYFYAFGRSGANSYGLISQIFSWISVAIIPIIFFLCFPSRKWVNEIINMQKK